MLSFSTSWNTVLGKPGQEIVEEILDLGFDAIELGHGLHASVVHEMLELRKKSSICCFEPAQLLPAPSRGHGRSAGLL